MNLGCFVIKIVFTHNGANVFSEARDLKFYHTVILETVRTKEYSRVLFSSLIFLRIVSQMLTSTSFWACSSA